MARFTISMDRFGSIIVQFESIRLWEMVKRTVKANGGTASSVGAYSQHAQWFIVYGFTILTKGKVS